jgi:hypothetical protein
MSEALAVGRIVRYKLTERETITKERVGAVVPAIVINVNPDQTADLGVFLNGRVDLPSVVHWEPEAKRIPLILAPLAWVGAVAQDMVNGEPASGMFGFPRREN